MPIEKMLLNRELFNRVIDHYLYRLHHVTGSESLQTILSMPIMGMLSTRNIEKRIEEVRALVEREGELTYRVEQARFYEDILTSAAKCYQKDLGTILAAVQSILPSSSLSQLEQDLQTLSQLLERPTGFQ